jgi:outer membrane protein assembly factor BamA
MNFENKSDTAKISITFISELLKDNPEIGIKINSYIDTKEIIDELDLKRALFIKSELIKLGADSSKIMLSNKGYIPFKNNIGLSDFDRNANFDEKYINKLKPNLKEKARYYNRRVEFEIVQLTNQR